MKCDVGDSSDDFICLYLTGENYPEQAFLESLVYGPFRRCEMVRNAAEAHTLIFSRPPQRPPRKRRKVAKQRITGQAQTATDTVEKD